MLRLAQRHRGGTGPEAMAAAGGTAVRAMGNDALIVKWNK